MKQMKLMELNLVNFKGIKAFELNAEGENKTVFGKNEVGKTSIFDAFIWLLFDKNSHNQKDFGIKTLVNGEVQHNLNHEVEATFLIDGQDLSLKKVFAEKWTKKRGSVRKEFTGHTTDYYIDCVPSKKKEFTDKVAEIVDEEIFKLLTSPSYFNEQLHWKDRRKTLLDIAGDVSDEEVIRSNRSLSNLTDILDGKDVEDLKKIIAAKRKEINQELERIPVRIDEINRNKPDTDGLDESNINTRLEDINNEIEAKNNEINDIKNGSEANQLKAHISDVDLKISKVKNQHEQDNQQVIYRLQAKLQEERSNASIIESKVKNNEQRKEMNDRNIETFTKDMAILRDKWTAKNKEEYTHEDNCVCPTCEQELPEEQVQATREKAEKQFNTAKSNYLEAVKEDGLQAKQKVESLKQENESLLNDINKYNEQLEEKRKACEKLQHEIEDAESNVKPLSENKDYQELIAEKARLNSEINNIESNVEDSINKVRQAMSELKEKQSALQLDLSMIKQFEQSNNRIAELEKQEEELAAEFEKQEEQLHLTEEFIRTKVDLLEEKINSKFKHARFNLFKQNINGGLEEICDTTFKGVPYKDMNDGAIINIGLDIIETLSKHYEVQAPIFIDNAEQVTHFFADINAQVIKLFASKNDAVLRIENSEEMELV
ncbi:AAA domain-containing protein [Gracilibacillus orientalis]|uniref:Nuclease SbcCD subunit C n=1 Tax=Gracilibacillus orientalis TaxID=334253 RepID=A0A1I4PLI7_9BACI|nr:AAA family ATPase [Gracilibacillus orientalis]SFM28679.1 AAA domain-containing protein [Gracilibacillus orientalis]